MTFPRVLLVTGEYPPARGGIADYAALLRDALSDARAAVQVLSRSPACGQGVHAVSGWGWSTLPTIGRLVRSELVDIVHLQYQAGSFAMHPAINLLPLYIARRHRRLVVTTFHDLRPPYLFPKAGRLRAGIVHQMARRSRAAIVTNPADERALSLSGAGVTRVPIGPNLPAPPEGLQVEERTVAFFGFPARSKGIVELIAALGRIERPRRPLLRLIGDDGVPSRYNDIVPRASIDGLARAHGVELSRTGFLAPQQASAALARAAVIALPHLDGASLRSGSLLAALQTGRPVVTFAPARVGDIEPIACLPQLVLVERGDLPGLITAIERCLESPPASGALPAMFRWGHIADRHMQLYATLLGGTGSS